MPKSLSIAWVACILALPPLAAAPATILTPNAISERVRTHNPDLAAARLRIREALGRMTQAGKLTNPNVEIEVENNSRFREGRIEIGFSQRFPVTDRLRLEKAISLTELKAAEAEVLNAERQIITKAHESLVKILATRLRHDLLDEQRHVANTFADILANATAKGEGSAIDLGQARLEASRFATELRQLDATATALLGELKPLLGMPAGELLLVGGTLPPPALPTTTPDPAKRPDYQAATFKAQAANTAVALEKARRYDDVESALFAATQRTEDVPAGFDNEAIIGLRLKIALPFWNKNEGAIAEAQARKERKDLEVSALAHGIRLEAESALAEMQEWLAVLTEINRTLLPLANEQTTLTENAYRNGQGDIQSVLRARERTLQLSSAKIDALREFHLARIRHEAASGT